MPLPEYLLLLMSNPVGNCNSVRLVQPLNIPWPYPLDPQLQAELVNITDCNDVQFWKAKLPIDIEEDWKVIDVSLDALKALAPKDVTEDGKTTPDGDKEPVPANAESPIVVKAVNLEKSKLVKPAQPLNAELLNFVIGLDAPLTVTVVKLVQPLNVSEPNVALILVGSEILVMLVQSENAPVFSILIVHGEAGQIMLTPLTPVEAKALLLMVNVPVTLLKSSVVRFLQPWKAESLMVKF